MQTAEQPTDEHFQQNAIPPKERISYLPPTTETRKLADEILSAIQKVSADNKISLTGLAHILEEIDMNRIGDYRNPVTDAIAAILSQNEDLCNVWREAMMMVRLDTYHKLTAENDKTFLGKILNVIHIR